jgi:hypothetical protein
LIISSIRGVGVFVLGLLIAVMGTAVAEFPIYRVTRPQMPGMLRMSYLLDTTIAFGLGYSSSSVSSYAPVSAIVGNNINLKDRSPRVPFDNHWIGVYRLHSQWRRAFSLA